MRNKYYIFTVLALILVVVVTAIMYSSSQPDPEKELESSPSTVVEEPTEIGEESQVVQNVEPAEVTDVETIEAVPTTTEPDQSVKDGLTSTQELEDFISVTEFFSAKVPTGWPAQEVMPGAAITMANSEMAWQRYNSGEAVQSGDLVINIGFLPFLLLQQNELKALDIQLDAPPDQFLESIMPIFRIREGVQVGEAELITLNDHRNAGLLHVTAEDREGLILMLLAGDKVIAIVNAVVFPGELSGFQELTEAVAAEVVFNGAQEALYGTLLGG